MPALTTLVRTCAALIVVLLPSVADIGAECLAPSTPCEELKRVQIVFYGEVLGIEAPDNGVPQRIRFRIARAFKGVKTGPWSGAFSWGPEDYPFSPDERVVVYATRRADGEWSTICGRTGAYDYTESALAEELAQLKTCRSTGK
jgi:hypothetical protein